MRFRARPRPSPPAWPSAPSSPSPSPSAPLATRCEPNTLVYCLFRYRHNRGLVTAILEKLEASKHAEADDYTLQLCYLMLIDPGMCTEDDR